MQDEEGTFLGRGQEGKVTTREGELLILAGVLRRRADSRPLVSRFIRGEKVPDKRPEPTSNRAYGREPPAGR